MHVPKVHDTGMVSEGYKSITIIHKFMSLSIPPKELEIKETTTDTVSSVSFLRMYLEFDISDLYSYFLQG
jgi:hypothetical protein